MISEKKEGREDFHQKKDGKKARNVKKGVKGKAAGRGGGKRPDERLYPWW